MLNSNFGYININKPAGPTSHDIVDRLRRITGIKKIGHAGTLDPFARGVLILGISRKATRNISKFAKLDKEYAAEIYLGAKSDTHDKTGKIIKTKCGQRDLGSIKKAVNNFVGEQKQVPPMYSAKKIKGKKLYELARQGKEVKREPADINVYSIEIIFFKWPILKVKIKCSSGTYVRSLARDIGRKLGCGAYLKELARIAIGKYKIEEGVALDILKPSNWHTFLFL